MRRAYAALFAVALANAAGSAPAAAEPLPTADAYRQIDFADGRGRLTARYAPVEPPPADSREIKVLQTPTGVGAGTAGARLLSEAAEGFRRRAEQDCHDAQARTLEASSPSGDAATAVEIVCEGFDPVSSDGRESPENSYLYARFELLRDTLVVMTYQWRSRAAPAQAVVASDLLTREVKPTLARLRLKLAARLAD
ncbi:MAG: hypothetical protein RIB45_00855 [Marivibrio sp.]|uniref:hypothetical protein n=1 Tax=Marivibrio sp. TaxID=2039719 RepID=UPI0032EC7009